MRVEIESRRVTQTSSVSLLFLNSKNSDHKIDLLFRVSVTSSSRSLSRNYKILYLKSGSVPQGIRRQLSNKVVVDLYKDLCTRIITVNVTIVNTECVLSTLKLLFVLII